MKRLNLVWILGINLWGGEEFIISYSAKMQNDLLKGESYKVSKVLYPKGEEGLKKGELQIVKMCKIIPQTGEEGDLERILKQERESVLDCLYSSGIKIYDEAIAKNLEARSRTIFKIPPKRVIVTFENGVINLGILEKK